MTSDLERALSKLRFDDQVLGYSLMTKAGRPFVSFAFPDELFPRVKDSIKLYKTDLRLMTIDTDKGLVVLAPVDDNWILTVLYVPELQLGLAIAKTKNVLRLLEGIELPPPPADFEESVESNLQVLESVAIKAASTAVEIPSAAAPTAVEEERVEVVVPPPKKELTPDDFYVIPSTVPTKGEQYSRGLSLDSDLHQEMKKIYRNFGFDVLMLVDGVRTVGQIAESMFQPTERVVELLKWAAFKKIVSVPEVAVAEGTKSAEAPMGRFVKLPLFEGDITKVRPEDRPVVELCKGDKTTAEIAGLAGIPEPRVVQIIAVYRKIGMKMVGKTI
ncbi:MAG: hypothetical protein HXY34_08400 [Candidatus Thorarchaeota archaeon]|nr:hypothetical protein [Candidatus Thorarchaeota archaeon]